MRIIKPFNGEVVAAGRVTVVVEGEPAEGMGCVLFDPAHGSPFGGGAARVVARGPVLWRDGVGVAQLGLPASAGPFCVAVGDARVQSAPVRIEVAVGSGPAVRFPLATVECNRSHFGGESSIPFDPVADVPALLAPGPMDSALRLLPLTTPQPHVGSEVLLPAFCLGEEHAAYQALLNLGSFHSSGSYAGYFRNVHVFQPSSLLLLQGDRIWSDTTPTAFFSDPELHQYPQMFRAGGRPGVVLDPVRTLSDILADNGVEPPGGVPMLVSNVGHGNHAHWMLNSLIAIHWLRDAILAGLLYLLVPARTDYLMDSIGSLGIPPSRVLAVQRGLYRLDEVVYASSASSHSSFNPPSDLVAMFARIRASCVPEGAGGPEKIYITRIGSGSRRIIGNEAALIAALEARGFVCVAPHELSFAEEVAVFSRARVIVGQLGAGLANIGFAPSGCIVVEIGSTNYTSNDFFFLAKALGHAFVRMMVQAGADDTVDLGEFRFDVPVDAVLERIDRLVGSPEYQRASGE